MPGPRPVPERRGMMRMPRARSPATMTPVYGDSGRGGLGYVGAAPSEEAGLRGGDRDARALPPPLGTLEKAGEREASQHPLSEVSRVGGG